MANLQPALAARIRINRIIRTVLYSVVIGIGIVLLAHGTEAGWFAIGVGVFSLGLTMASFLLRRRLAKLRRDNPDWAYNPSIPDEVRVASRVKAAKLRVARFCITWGVLSLVAVIVAVMAHGFLRQYAIVMAIVFAVMACGMLIGGRSIMRRIQSGKIPAVRP